MYWKKGQWRATQPTHLIGWNIVLVSDDTPDDNDCIELLVEKNDTKERRNVRANQYAIPDAIISKRWNNQG